MSWIIVNKEDQHLCWSNSFGWCSETYDTFTDEEMSALDLPMNGEWQSVSYRVSV
tara:strand:+ start:320 stop:484 length:165 start_codon:yes stop_codon:yes gene_type:complete